MLPISRILHPTDFSPYSEAAFRLACSLARDYGAHLLIVHVKSMDTIVAETYLPPAEFECAELALREKLHELRPPESAVQVDYRLTEGNSASEILRTAREDGSDLIVMGTHGRTGLSRLVMGSVAEQVVRKALCPVLTVKLPSHLAVPREEPALAEMQGDL